METKNIQSAIKTGETSLGIELGSTRIKAVLIDKEHNVLACGAHDWENRMENGMWTYRLEDVWNGVRDAYAKLAAEVFDKYGERLTLLGCMGVSAMMHGYLPFDKNDNQLAEFRTWRNTTTEKAALILTKRFGFNIPQRWSIAHLYQAILNGEKHVDNIYFLTTLAGYVHYMLTGEKAIGVGEASGMFPVDSSTCNYDAKMCASFDEILIENGFMFNLENILPCVLKAGEYAGNLTEKGAALLDPSGRLKPGVPLCPPEGDAGTGMTATNSVACRTGNVSAGTSVFAMLVLEKPLSRVYTEIDMVTTPSGSPVAMVHCNTCTSDLDAWVALLGEAAREAGAKLSKGELYDLFYQKALEAEADCGGLINYNYYSGEPVTGLEGGCPLFVRRPKGRLTLANFARAQIYSAIATLKIGMDILFENENVKIDSLLGHGGLFKTPVAGQKLLAGALNVPLAVMKTAGEGGPWGMAVLASFMLNKEKSESLENFLENKVFKSSRGDKIMPDKADTEGFASFIHDYKSAISAEKAAVDALN